MSRFSRPSWNAARAKLAHFLAGTERLFVHPLEHPTRPTGFCPCEGTLSEQLRFYLRAMVWGCVLRTDFNRLKLWLLRHCGVRIGRHVYLAPAVWLDPAFPELLTLEDDVFVGVGARLATHEFRAREFRAGRLIIRRGSVIGGFALIGPGVEIGPGATVAAGAAVGRDVPAGSTAIGNPARTVRGSGNTNASRFGTTAADSPEAADGA
jgi:acetyltransferase-like isoleucine patch superfamily enzyme